MHQLPALHQLLRLRLLPVDSLEPLQLAPRQPLPLHLQRLVSHSAMRQRQLSRECPSSLNLD